MSSASGFSSAIAGNCSSSGARVASRASKERGGSRFNNQPVPILSHDGIIAGQLELPWNSDSLISAILEEFDVPFWYHCILRNKWYMFEHMPFRSAPQAKAPLGLTDTDFLSLQ